MLVLAMLFGDLEKCPLGGETCPLLGKSFITFSVSAPGLFHDSYFEEMGAFGFP